MSESIISMKRVSDSHIAVTFDNGREVVGNLGTREFTRELFWYHLGSRPALVNCVEYFVAGDKGGLNQFGTFWIGISRDLYNRLYSLPVGDSVRIGGAK
jgi:hypothetical protein